MPYWRIFIRRHWRILSRVGAAVLFALLAVLIALPRASADAPHDTAAALSRALLFSGNRMASRSFATLSAPPVDAGTALNAS